jgi:hypothetical protein
MKGPPPPQRLCVKQQSRGVLSAGSKREISSGSCKSATFAVPGTKGPCTPAGRISTGSLLLRCGPTLTSTSFKILLPALSLPFHHFPQLCTTQLLQTVVPVRRSLSPCKNGVSERHPLGRRHQRHRIAAVAACTVSSHKLWKSRFALLTDLAFSLSEELFRGPARRFCT